MAEEATPPAVATWRPADVAAWVRTLKLDGGGAEALARAVAAEEVDGAILLSFKDRAEVKVCLGVSTGKATQLWRAIEGLRRAPTAAGGSASRDDDEEDVEEFALLPRAPGTEAWTHAASLLQNTWAKREAHSFGRLVEVQEVRNQALQARYAAHKASMAAGVVDGNELMVFHGSAHDAVESIARGGFRAEYQRSAAGAWQRFGPGFYFALQASKAHEYPLGEMEALAPGKHLRTMILCKVAQGRVLRATRNMAGLTGSAPAGYDAIHGEATADGPLNYDELVVYAEEAILPYAVATYEYTKHDDGDGAAEARMATPEGERATAAAAESSSPSEEELFQVLRTGELMTVEQLFHAGLSKAECRPLEAAAAAARESLGASVAGAQANVEVLERGVTEVECALQQLAEGSAALERAIEEELASVREQVCAALARRERELKGAAERECAARRDTLEQQRAALQDACEGQRQLCVVGATALSQPARRVVEQREAMQAALEAASVRAARVEVACGATIARELDSGALRRSLQASVASFGSIGRPAPVLRGYADPAPVYAVGAAIAPNLPQGVHLEADRGLRYAATGLPAGLTLDASTGALRGTPTQATGSASAVEVTLRHESGTVQTQLRIAVEAARRLYALGGYDGSNRLSSCEVYDAAADRWRAIAPMGSKRGCLAAAVVEGRLYALGGWDRSNFLSSCEVYDAAADRWRAIAPMGSKRRYLAAAVMS